MIVINQETIQVLFALLRSAVCGNTLPQQEKELYKNEMLSALYAVSKKHDIAHLLAVGIDKNSLPIVDDSPFKKEMLMAVYRYTKINYDYEKLCEIFENKKIPFMPLKGSVLRKYYPEPWMRTNCDIDVLIHNDDINRAIQALCEANYIRQNDVTTHDCSLMSPNKVHLELHYSLKQEDLPFSDELLKFVWNCCTVKEKTTYHYVMHNEMFLFYHIAHMAKHFIRGGCGVRPFIDLWLLNQKMPIEPEKLNNMLKQANLLEFYQSASKLSLVWMEIQPHNDTTKAMEQFVLSGGVYGSISNSATVKAAKGEGKVKTFLKLMFLPRKHLEIIYPNLKNHLWLMPYYQAKRWCGVFNKNKRTRISNLTMARNSVPKEEQSNISNLLIDLGLK